jgi:hypothetical protein
MADTRSLFQSYGARKTGRKVDNDGGKSVRHFVSATVAGAGERRKVSGTNESARDV